VTDDDGEDDKDDVDKDINVGDEDGVDCDEECKIDDSEGWGEVAGIEDDDDVGEDDEYVNDLYDLEKNGGEVSEDADDSLVVGNDEDGCVVGDIKDGKYDKSCVDFDEDGGIGDDDGVDDNADSAELGEGEEDLVGDIDGEDGIMVSEDNEDCGEVCDDGGVGAEDLWDVVNSGKAVEAVSEDDGK